MLKPTLRCQGYARDDGFILLPETFRINSNHKTHHSQHTREHNCWNLRPM